MKNKILLLDDEAGSFAGSLQQSLSSGTWEVFLTKSAQHAVEKSAAGEIDLLLMNIDSPKAAGWEAIDEITEENPFLPVIVISRQPELRNLAEAAGARALVEKPVDVMALLLTMQELLAEPLEIRMRHTCDQDFNFQQVPASGESFREQLDRRSTTPFGAASPYHRAGINE